MRVQMLLDVSGTRQGQEWPKRGEFIDVPDWEAEDLFRAGLAKAADPEPEPAEVAPPPTETTQ